MPYQNVNFFLQIQDPISHQQAQDLVLYLNVKCKFLFTNISIESNFQLHHNFLHLYSKSVGPDAVSKEIRPIGWGSGPLILHPNSH